MHFLQIVAPLAFACLGTTFSILKTDQFVIENDNPTAEGVREVLISNKVIGDVLDDFTPTYYLKIDYPHDTVMLGNDIPVKEVSKRPSFAIYSFDDSATPQKSNFTLALTDPDAKSRDNPKWSEMCHWLVTNLTTPIQSDFQTTKAGELKSYQPPGPPPKTGAHRYVFVLLEGDTSNLKPPKERQHWGYGKIRHGVRDWAEENDLNVVAANFFFTANKKQ